MEKVVITLDDLNQRLYEANKTKYPNVPVTGLVKPRHSDKTANGLTKAIIAFFEVQGHYANRIQTQGQFRAGKWTRGTTKRGTPDVSAIVNGRALAIEVKHGKDRLSDAQKQQAEKIQSAGGVWYCARTFEGFTQWFNETFKAS